MEKFVMMVNGGVYYKDDGKNVFDGIESVKIELVNWNGGKNSFDVCDEVYSVDDLVEEMLVCGDSVEVSESDMCERGDDFVELSLIKLEE